MKSLFKPAAVLEFDTPEGVPLRFEAASISRRAFAFGIDIGIIWISLMATGFFLLLVGASLDDFAWVGALFMLFSFVARNFYFLLSEMHGRGQTYGKRVAGIRVVDVHGRPLSANALFLRNITRDIELFLPLIAIFAPQAVIRGAPWWAGFFALVWAVAVSGLPLLTRRRLRAGDIIAGTIVVRDPNVELLDDLSTRIEEDARFVFSNQQLDMYGVYELQVLEGILREAPDTEVLERIAGKIVDKIAWSSDNYRRDPRNFLEVFYQQLRKRHEQRILLGDRQDSKQDGKLNKRDRNA